MTYTYDQLRAAVTKKGYKWFTKNLSLNFIWIRTSDEITNRFTDWLYVAWLELGGKEVICIPATTKPGLKGSILEPVTVEGVTGTAVIKPNQYISAWQFRDQYSGFSHYPYFHQVGEVDYWRDGDKDNEIDKVNDQDKKIFGTHWHRMSQTDTYGSGQVNNWSLGCMGAPEPEFRKILPVVRGAVEFYGRMFTGTIMELKDFEV